MLHRLYCGNITYSTAKCDPYYIQNNVTIVNGIRGLASGVFFGKIAIFFFNYRGMKSTNKTKRNKNPEVFSIFRREHMGQFPGGGSVNLLRT